MNNNNLLMLAALGVAAYFVISSKKTVTNQPVKQPEPEKQLSGIERKLEAWDKIGSSVASLFGAVPSLFVKEEISKDIDNGWSGGYWA